MTAQATAEVVPIKNLPTVVAGGPARALVPQDIEGAWRVAGYLHDAGILPHGINTRSQVMIAVLHGLEIGLPPMQALQSIAVINGKPVIYGDTALALVRTSGQLEWIKETIEGEGDATTARCVVKRKGELEPIVGEFSIADAKTANLWGKRGKNGEPTPWVTYWKRMLKARARAFSLRDGFADVLRGMHVREEVEDYDTGEHRGPENAKVINDDGPPAPPPPPSEEAPPDPNAKVAAAEIVEDTGARSVAELYDTAPAQTVILEDDGPPDPLDIPAALDRRPKPAQAVDPIDEAQWLRDFEGALGGHEDMVSLGETQVKMMMPMKSKISADAWRQAEALVRAAIARIGKEG